MSEDEDMIVWQDVLDLVVAGKTSLRCPFCTKGELKISEQPLRRTRVECPTCRKFIEVALSH